MDDFKWESIHRKVHEFWFWKQLPTLDKILITVNEDPDLHTYKRSTLHSIIRDLNFVYVEHGRNSAFIEREDIVLWRIKYIEDIRKYRSQRRTIYYLDKTWVKAGDNTVTPHRETIVCGPSTSPQQIQQQKGNVWLLYILGQKRVLSKVAY